MNKDFSHRNLKMVFFILFILIIAFYMIWRGGAYLSGPIITIISPIDGERVTGETFFVKGNVKNVKEIKLNGREINIDQYGNFNEELISHSPMTLITITAIDKYGKEKEKFLKIIK